MVQNIRELFSQAVNQFRTEHELRQARRELGLSALERDFETIKDQVRQLKPQLEAHRRVNYCWIFSDKIIIDFYTGLNRPTAQVIVRVYHPGNNRFKQGLYGYQSDGYEMTLAGVDEAVAFIATQCGKLLA